MFVAVAFTAGAATGFGTILIAVTLSALVYPIPTVLPLLVLASVLLTGYLVVRHHEHVDWRLLLRRVLPLMGAGLMAGYAIFVRLSPRGLELLLGAFVILVAGGELRRQSANATAPRGPMPALPFTTVTLFAGVVHGVAATGGPLLVYALGRSELPKARFRATLAVVWLALNLALAAAYAASGRITLGTIPFLLALVPVIALAIALGEWLHVRMDEAGFRRVVLVLLLASGVTLLL